MISSGSSVQRNGYNATFQNRIRGRYGGYDFNTEQIEDLHLVPVCQQLNRRAFFVAGQQTLPGTVVGVCYGFMVINDDRIAIFCTAPKQGRLATLTKHRDTAILIAIETKLYS